MNRQRFLAELRRLLVYMTEEDREEAVRRCTEAFEAAGPDGEAALIEQLGSPTKTAIALSRGYEPGSLPDVFPKRPVKPERPEKAEKPAAPAEKEPADPWASVPEVELPSLEESPAPKQEEASAPGQEEAPASEEESPAPVACDPVYDEAAPIDAPEGEEIPWEDELPPAFSRSRSVIERTMPLGLGIPLFLLVFAALGVPLAVLCAALAIVLLVPGCAVLFGAYLIVVGGLWCMSYMADAVLLFGLALVALAVGLIVLWLGLWLGVKLLSAYGRGFGWVGGELLGRRVQADA